MCWGSSVPNVTEIKSIVPADTPAEAPRLSDSSVVSKRSQEKARLQAMAGTASTIATSGSGLSTAGNISGKTLLGE